MLHLLNLLAAIALLVWGTHIVRTSVLRVFGESLRGVLAKSFSNRLSSLVAGLCVTTVVQSSTATCLIVASFVGKGLVATTAALAVMLGADVGTALMAVVFSFDLSWLSPLLIFVGVVVYASREKTTSGRLGQVAIGLGLITLALQLMVHSYAGNQIAAEAAQATLESESMQQSRAGRFLSQATAAWLSWRCGRIGDALQRMEGVRKLGREARDFWLGFAIPMRIAGRTAGRRRKLEASSRKPPSTDPTAVAVSSTA